MHLVSSEHTAVETGLPRWLHGEDSACQAMGLIPGSGRSPGVGNGKLLLSGESSGQRILEGDSPWGHTASDTAEELSAGRIHTYRRSPQSPRTNTRPQSFDERLPRAPSEGSAGSTQLSVWPWRCPQCPLRRLVSWRLRVPSAARLLVGTAAASVTPIVHKDTEGPVWDDVAGVESGLNTGTLPAVTGAAGLEEVQAQEGGGLSEAPAGLGFGVMAWSVCCDAGLWRRDSC